MKTKGILYTACGGNFLGFLDVTLTNLALPDLRHDFPASGLVELSWVVSLYAIVFAACLAPAGRLADTVGRRQIFLMGVSVFTIGSLVSALAPSVPLLLVGRGIQAAGGASMVPASLAFVLADTAPERRRTAIGLWGASGSVAAAIGPTVGGLLVDWSGWRSLFVLNVVVGSVLVAATVRIPPAPATTRQWPDWLGAALLGLGAFGLILGVTEGSTWGWDAASTLSAITLGAVGVLAAVVRSRGQAVPAFDVRLWRIRSYARSNLAFFFYGAALYAWLLVGVLFLIQMWGYTELRAGLAMTPGALSAALTGVLVSRATRWTSPRVLVSVGGAVFAASAVVFRLVLDSDPHFWAVWLPVGIFVGAGIGAAVTGLSSASALSVPPVDFAAATGLSRATSQLGGAIGIAIMVAFLTTDGAPLGRFLDVFAYCGAVAGVLALVGLSLGSTPPASTASPPPHEEAAQLVD